MRRLSRVAIVLAVLLCLGSAVWVVLGPGIGDVVRRATVVGGIAAVAALAVAAAALWPRSALRAPAPGTVGVEQADAAMGYQTQPGSGAVVEPPAQVAAQEGIHGGSNTVAGAIDTLHRQGPAVQGPAAGEETVVNQSRRSPAVTDRWRHTTDGVTSYLRQLARVSMPRPELGPGFSPSRPTVRVGFLIACDPPGPKLTGTQRRAHFVELLNSDAIMAFVRAVTSVGSDLRWGSCGGEGPRLLGAVLSGASAQSEIPVASAQLEFPEPKAIRPSTDPDRAEFILELRCVSAEGAPCPPARLPEWRERMLLALALPAAIAGFLQDRLDLTTYDTPNTEFGTWWTTDNDITYLVDTTGLRVEPGTSRSAQFTGWAVADAEGEPANQVVRAILGQLAEYTLHLEHYEDLLDVQSSAPSRQDDMLAPDPPPDPA